MRIQPIAQNNQNRTNFGALSAGELLFRNDGNRLVHGNLLSALKKLETQGKEL